MASAEFGYQILLVLSIRIFELSKFVHFRMCEFFFFAHTESPCRPYYSAPTHPGLATLCHHITLFLSFRLASPLRPYLWARLFISAPYLWARKGEALICGHAPAAEMQMMVVSTFFLLPVVATIFPLSDFQTNLLLLILSSTFSLPNHIEQKVVRNM